MQDFKTTALKGEIRFFFLKTCENVIQHFVLWPTIYLHIESMLYFKSINTMQYMNFTPIPFQSDSDIMSKYSNSQIRGSIIGLHFLTLYSINVLWNNQKRILKSDNQKRILKSDNQKRLLKSDNQKRLLKYWHRKKLFVCMSITLIYKTRFIYNNSPLCLFRAIWLYGEKVLHR